MERQSSRTTLMAILNVTPDSFSDGGRFTHLDALLSAAEEAIAHGAAVLDVGGESTRPNAQAISTEEELNRILPALHALRLTFPTIPLSVDTRKSQVAWQAVQAGAAIVNDVSGLRFDPEMAAVVAHSGARLVLMHSIGTPETMQRHPDYSEEGGVVQAVTRFFERQMESAERVGLARERVILDPGFGFGKTVEDNFALLHGLPKFKAFGRPLLVGLSRKSFLTLNRANRIPPDQREALTAAAHLVALQGGADILRLHDLATQRPVIDWAERWLASHLV